MKSCPYTASILPILCNTLWEILMLLDLFFCINEGLQTWIPGTNVAQGHMRSDALSDTTMILWWLDMGPMSYPWTSQPLRLCSISLTFWRVCVLQMLLLFDHSIQDDLILGSWSTIDMVIIKVWYFFATQIHPWFVPGLSLQWQL